MEGYNFTLKYLFKKHQHLIHNLLQAKIFILKDKNIHKCLLKTNNKIQHKKLPFNPLFIETLQSHSINKGLSEVLMNGIYIQSDEGDKSFMVFCILEEYINKDNFIPLHILKIGFSIYKTGLDYKEIKEISIKCGVDFLSFKKFCEGLAEYVCSFLDFLNNPEVELIDIIKTKKQNNKRELKGKAPIPSHTYIRITGKLKKYFNELSSGKSFSYNHQFWVRGHFRTLKSEERYGCKVGAKIWIVPYIKGKGILLEKTYKVGK